MIKKAEPDDVDNDHNDDDEDEDNITCLSQAGFSPRWDCRSVDPDYATLL